MSKPNESLQRLVASGKCDCCNIGEYTDQLRELAEKVANAKQAKKRERFFKALGDESRQRIISLLTVREMCVCEMMSALKMTQPTTSHHLKILEDAEIVKSKKDGKWVYYSITNHENITTIFSLFK